MKLSNGVTIEDVPPEEEQVIRSIFTGYLQGVVRVGPSRMLMPTAYKLYAQRYLDFKFCATDVVVATYPKCGTTWMQEVVWTMCHNPDLDQPDTNLAIRSPFLEFDAVIAPLVSMTGHNPEMVKALAALAPDAAPDGGMFLAMAQHVPDRRVLKTHLPFSVLPEGLLDNSKVIYVVRNVKDMVCSYLHHHRLIKVHNFTGTDQQFVDYFCKHDLLFGSYAHHLAEAWALRTHKNLLIVSFEDLKKNTLAELKKINAFIGAGLNDKQLENVRSHTAFSSMSRRQGPRMTEDSDAVAQGVSSLFNAKINNKSGFFRKGEVGSWKTDLTPEMSQQIDRWTKENITERIGLTFSYEI